MRQPVSYLEQKDSDNRNRGGEKRSMVENRKISTANRYFGGVGKMKMQVDPDDGISMGLIRWQRKY